MAACIADAMPTANQNFWAASRSRLMENVPEFAYRNIRSVEALHRILDVVYLAVLQTIQS